MFTLVSVMGQLEIFLYAVVCYDNAHIVYHKGKTKCNRRPVSYTYTLAFYFMYRQ
jgi:hypothetical protein